AVPRREAGRYAARVRSLLRVDEAAAEDRRDVPVAEVGAVGDEVLDGGQDAVGGAALAVGDSELARATEAAVDEPGLVGRAPLVEAVRVHRVSRQRVGRVVLIAACARPSNVVKDRERRRLGERDL